LIGDPELRTPRAGASAALRAFVDLHPFRNGVMVTGGAYCLAKELTGSAAPSGLVEIGGQAFTPAEE
jgi:hypothetical protein